LLLALSLIMLVMASEDWQKCKFLESADNLRPLVKLRFAREPSSSIAREIVACLQQGRLFYEAAESSPLEIKPLQQFYGMAGYAKALITAKRLQSLSTLKHSHGIRDVSDGNARIADLRVQVSSTGTFQEFNDVLAPLTRLCYIDESTKSHTITLPSATSADLVGIQLSLRDVLSRISGLESLYLMTFNERPKCKQILVEIPLLTGRDCRIRVDEDDLFSDRKSLQKIVENLRSQFPFLEQWRLNSAQQAWGKSIIFFTNRGNTGINEFSDDYLAFRNDSYEEQPVPGDSNDRFPLETAFPPLAGGFRGLSNMVSPVNKLHLSEFSLHYLALFSLCSLVRYRPQIWTHAISRSVFRDIPADDRALSLIEQFLLLNSRVIPSMVSTILNPHEDEWFK
jgi:hypothetical protein